MLLVVLNEVSNCMAMLKAILEGFCPGGGDFVQGDFVLIPSRPDHAVHDRIKTFDLCYTCGGPLLHAGTQNS